MLLRDPWYHVTIDIMAYEGKRDIIFPQQCNCNTCSTTQRPRYSMHCALALLQCAITYMCILYIYMHTHNAATFISPSCLLGRRVVYTTPNHTRQNIMQLHNTIQQYHTCEKSPSSHNSTLQHRRAAVVAMTNRLQTKMKRTQQGQLPS